MYCQFQMSVEMAFFQAVACAVGLSCMQIQKKQSCDDKHLLATDCRSENSYCKFLKSGKFKANLIHAMYFESVKLFSVTYLE